MGIGYLWAHGDEAKVHISTTSIMATGYNGRTITYEKKTVLYIDAHRKAR